MPFFNSISSKINKLSQRFNKVVRIANRASNIERQIKSIAKDTKEAITNPDPQRPAARMPPPRRPTYPSEK